MSAESNIEWTDATWNPIVGCSIVSAGCKLCYAMKDAWRKHHNPSIPHYHGLTKKVNGHAVWTGKIAIAPDHILTAPLHWKKPKRIFVNSMGDLFHESIPDAEIDKVFAVMALCPQHQFQVLTKRAERMREYMTTHYRADEIGDAMIEVGDIQPGFKCVQWPFKNVWLGVSCEDQDNANERIPHLLATSAAIRFVSAEPLIGPIDFSDYLVETAHTNWDWYLDWIIVGGESGRDARPMNPKWALSIKNQCEMAGVEFFFKQWGTWLPLSQSDPDRDYGCNSFQVFETGSIVDVRAYKLDKKRSGRKLDGKEYNGFPKVAA